MASIMGGLQAEKYDRQYDDSDLLKRIWRYFRPYRRQLTVIVFATMLMAVIGTAPTLIVAKGVQVIAETGDQSIIPWLILTIFAAGVAYWLVNWVKRLYSVKAVESVILDMRTSAFTAAANQDLSFYDEFSSGRIVSRITSDTEEFGRVIILAVDLVQQLTTATILLVLLLTIEVRLTLILLLMTPLVMGAALSFRRIARQVTRQSSRVLAEVNKSIQESVTGIAVAKNFRQEQALYDDFIDVNQQAYAVNLRRGLVLALIFPTLMILLGFATASLVYFGGRAALAGIIAVSSWYLFVATVDRFWFPLLNLSAFWSQFQQGLAAAERVFALIDSESSVVQHANQSPPLLSGHISFKNVDFSYNEREKILHDFTLDMPVGKTFAIVGHTGAGKSSIIRLVTRFYEFGAGQICIDGHDIRSFDLNTYRAQLGIVSQVPFLFSGTVADNIRYGRPDATDADIIAVANQIGDGEWLDTLPDGLESEVGERGSRLSMGQRQLVALTRVLVSNPTVFILDEATANIDPFTEAQIQEALRLVMHRRTSIVIAHRLSTVRSADCIVVLEKGRIIELGTHEQLMQQGGEYADLYNTYFRHQSIDYISQRGWEQVSLTAD